MGGVLERRRNESSLLVRPLVRRRHRAAVPSCAVHGWGHATALRADNDKGLHGLPGRCMEDSLHDHQRRASSAFRLGRFERCRQPKLGSQITATRWPCRPSSSTVLHRMADPR
ncbi:hypothetical protein T492DRAFT_396897 [Pavlovales sp. CCMP2436]|nr:hypothetical protein T492DRAFT_396897 [Pavlovales sp. CCMP2436]